MTTITTTTGHQRTPLIAALATGAALVVGGAIGVAWEQDNDTPASTPAPAYTHSYTRYFYWVAPTTSDELSGPTSDSPGGATTTNAFSGTTHPYPTTRTTSGSPGGATTADEFSRTTSGSIPATGSPDGYTTSQECRGCRRRE